MFLRPYGSKRLLASPSDCVFKKLFCLTFIHEPRLQVHPIQIQRPFVRQVNSIFLSHRDDNTHEFPHKILTFNF